MESISDTLGWILYKRGIYQRAAKLPENPEIQYQLGMVSSPATPGNDLQPHARFCNPLPPSFMV